MAKKFSKQFDSVQLLVDEGMAALEQEDYRRAVECFRQALQLSPMLNDVRQLLAYALDQQLRQGSRPASVLPEKSGAKGIAEEVVFDQKARVTATRPRRPFLLFFFWLAVAGFLLLTSGVFFILFNEPIFQWLTSVIPQEIQPLPREEKEAMSMYDTAEIYFKQARYDDAIATLEKALALNPPSRKQIEDKLALVYNAKGEALYDKGKYLSAAEAYEKALTYNSQVVDYFYNAGWAYYRYALQQHLSKKPARKYFELSEKSFEKALEIDSGHLPAYQGLARVYTRLNRPELTARMYKKIIELAPESYEAELARRQLKNMFGESVK